MIFPIIESPSRPSVKALRGSKSLTSACSSRKSSTGIYGGLETIKSNCSSFKTVKTSEIFNSSCFETLCFSAFCSAICKAFAEISRPIDRAFSTSCRIEIEIQPEPTPTSQKRGFSLRAKSQSRFRRLIQFRDAESKRLSLP